MPTPTTDPTSALIAAVPAKVLQALTRRKSGLFKGCKLVRGEGTYLALVDYEPGDPHDEREIEVARELSANCEGPVYVVSFRENDERVTTCRRGKVAKDLQYDKAPDPELFVIELELGGMFPPKPPGTRSFMFVENATIEAVEDAIGEGVKRERQTLRLEPKGAHVLGWLENRTLGSFPTAVSAELSTRVFHTLDREESFVVIVKESGTKIGMFETPRTDFTEEETLIDSILGETTRDGILTAMGAPLDK